MVEEKDNVQVDEETSIVSPSTEILTKHPLQNEWDFWYFKPNPLKQWKENLTKVSTINTVEDFWALYNHIEIPSNLQPGCDYNLFKHGIEPMWEDIHNRNGGRLVIMFKKGGQTRKQEDEIWLEVLLCLIGEAFGEESDQICGAVFNIRSKANKLCIWTSDYKNERAIKKICEIIKFRTGYTREINYEIHKEDAVKKNGNNLLYSF